MSNKDRIVEGVLAIHKPPSITSAQVIRDAQAAFKHSKLFAPAIAQAQAKIEAESKHQKRRRRTVKRAQDVKIGHGGTLDPMATGVLILGIGAGTKELGKFTNDCTKTYEGVFHFGVATDTYDRTGKITKRAKYDHITRENVEGVLDKYRGKIMQTPPAYSALKVNGKPMYEYARMGLPIPKLDPRPAEVLRLEVIEWLEPGTHSHRWPADEADEAAKILTEKTLNHEMSNEEKDQDMLSTESITNRLKRRLEDVEEPIKDDFKRRRASSANEPLMSGALPPAPQNGAADITTSIESPQPSKSLGLPPASASETAIGADAPAVKLLITATSGFYVRSLCQELGVAVGSLATLSELVRTQQGNFKLGENVLPYEILQRHEDFWAPEVEKLLGAKLATKNDDAVEIKAENTKEPEDIKIEVVTEVLHGGLEDPTKI